MRAMDRTDKIVHRSAVDALMLYNKLSRATRRRLKRSASKAVRQDFRRRDVDAA